MSLIHPLSLREQFLAFDDRLVRAGVPPLTGWWREGIGTWLDAYDGGGALEFWACAGRGSSKSTALYKLALFFAVFGDFAVPPGERHFAIVLSRLKEEASKAIPILDQWLTMLGVAHHVAGDVVELDALPRGIRVVAASVAASSGWRAFIVLKDERAKWPMSGVDERDAEEIDTSSSAMTATHARAPIVTFGSAWLTLGIFHETIAAGTTPERVVRGPAPTWVAAPHITETDCRKKERNARRFLREYASIADDASEESLLEPAIVDRALRAAAGDVPAERGCTYSAAMDPSLGRNAWSFCIAGPRTVGDKVKASIVLAREYRAPHGQTLDPASVLQSIAQHCSAYAVHEVRTDQFHGEALAAIAERLRLRFTVDIDKPTSAERLRRYEGMATRFLDDAIELPRDRVLRADLLAIRRRVAKSGDAFTIYLGTTADGRHADYAPACALALERVALDDDAPPAWTKIGQASRNPFDPGFLDNDFESFIANPRNRYNP